MTIDDGETWNWISEDAYDPSGDEDPPQHTALDHYVREQHYHLGKHQDPVSKTYPLEVDGTLPAKFSSVHWSAFAYTTMMAWSQDNQVTIYWVGQVDNTSVELLPFVLNMEEGAVQTNEVYKFTLNQATSKRYHKTTIVLSNDWGQSGDYPIMAGMAVKSPLPTGSSESVSPTGGRSFATLSSSPSQTGDHLAMWDGRNTHRRYDILRYADTGFETTSDSLNFAYTPDMNQRIFNNTQWGELSGARTYSLSVSTRGDYDPYAREMIRPNIPPRYDRGAGQHLQRSEELYRKPRTFSGHAQNLQSKPDSQWGRRPKWRWVEGGNNETYTQMTRLRNASGQPIIKMPMVVSMIDKSATLASGGLVDNLQSAYQAASTVEFEVQSVIKTADGKTTLYEQSSSHTLPALPPSADANSTFLQQIYLHLEGARDDSLDGDENWIAKEGQLYISNFQRGSADHQALQVITPTLTPPSLPDSQAMYPIETTINLSDLSQKRLYLIGGCISDYLLPEE